MKTVSSALERLAGPERRRGQSGGAGGSPRGDVSYVSSGGWGTWTQRVDRRGLPGCSLWTAVRPGPGCWRHKRGLAWRERVHLALPPAAEGSWPSFLPRWALVSSVLISQWGTPATSAGSSPEDCFGVSCALQALLEALLLTGIQIPGGRDAVLAPRPPLHRHKAKLLSPHATCRGPLGNGGRWGEYQETPDVSPSSQVPGRPWAACSDASSAGHCVCRRPLSLPKPGLLVCKPG